MSVVFAALALAGGLHGIVTRGPITPVCKVNVPCSAPAVGAVLVFSRAGSRPVRIRTGAGGRYSVRLAPGGPSAYLPPADGRRRAASPS